MKIIYILLLIIGVSAKGAAQNLNLGFEDWHTNVNFVPVTQETHTNVCHPYLATNSEEISSSGVITDNSILPHWSAQPFGILRTTDSHSGTYAAIVNMWYNGAKGLLALGNSADVYANIPKVSLNNKLFGVSGYYKYKKDAFMVNDTLNKRTLLNIATYKTNLAGVLEEITRDSLVFSASDTYKNFSLAITYPNANMVPDSVSIWFESKGYQSGTTSCTLSHFLYLDDLQLHFNPLSIKENIQSVFKIYPNPAKEILTVEYPDAVKVQKMQLTDLSGRIVKIFANIKDKTLYVNDLAKGTYILNIDTQQGNFSEKIIIN